jgi:hypothetical protein
MYSQGPLEVDEGGTSRGCDYGRKAERFNILKTEEGALSQGMRVGSKSWKGQRDGFLELPGGRPSFSQLDFSSTEAHFGLLTSRTER